MIKTSLFACLLSFQFSYYCCCDPVEITINFGKNRPLLLPRSVFILLASSTIHVLFMPPSASTITNFPPLVHQPTSMCVALFIILLRYKRRTVRGRGCLFLFSIKYVRGGQEIMLPNSFFFFLKVPHRPSYTVVVVVVCHHHAA